MVVPFPIVYAYVRDATPRRTIIAVCEFFLILFNIYIYIFDELTDNANEVFGFLYDSTAW